MKNYVFLLALLSFANCGKPIYYSFLGKWTIKEATIDKQTNASLQNAVIDFQRNRKCVVTNNNQTNEGTWLAFAQGEPLYSEEYVDNMDALEVMIKDSISQKTIKYKGRIPNQTLKLTSNSSDKDYYLLLEK